MTPDRGPSSHLLWTELACHDGTPYPQHWRTDRAIPMAANFEDIRQLLGDEPLVILSGYRTPAFNARTEGAAAKSQHVEGRALDLWHPSMDPREVYDRIMKQQRAGGLPLLGGIGLYRSFVHVDVRPKTAGHLATWTGPGVD